MEDSIKPYRNDLYQWKKAETNLEEVFIHFMQKATQHLQRISPNAYQKHNYKDMVFKCTHLIDTQKQLLLNLFAQHDELFSGTLGSIPNYKVHLDIQPNATPYFAKPYNIPQSIYQIARDKVDELTRIGVLI